MLFTAIKNNTLTLIQKAVTYLAAFLFLSRLNDWIFDDYMLAIYQSMNFEDQSQILDDKCVFRSKKGMRDGIRKQA